MLTSSDDSLLQVGLVVAVVLFSHLFAFAPTSATLLPPRCTLKFCASNRNTIAGAMADLRTVTITAMSAIFTPPPDCTNSWTYEDALYNSVPGGLLIQNMDSVSLDSTCFPASFSGNGRAPSSIQVYSPGACPSGYATPGQFQNSFTTTAICCPSSYSYGSTYSTINFFTSSSVLFMGCISQFSGTTTVSARGNSSQIAVSGAISMWAQPITVQFQQRDLSLFGSSTSTSSSTTSSGQPTSGGSILTTDLPAPTADPAQQTTSSSSAPSDSSTSTSLSTAAQAGIGVGVAVLALSLVGFLLFFIIRRRRLRRSAMVVGGGQGADGKEPMRQYGQGGAGAAAWERRELDGSAAAEYRTELDGGVVGGNGRVDPQRKQRPGEVCELE